jgi:hypothetical protein
MPEAESWTCSVCGTVNAAAAEQCTHCGRLRAVEPSAMAPPREEEEPVEVDLEVDRGLPAINP